MIRHASLIGAALLFTVSAVQAQFPAVDAFEQNQRLGRGVNVLGYDPIWRAREQGRFQARYFGMLKDAGFNSVRVNLHPFRAMNPADGLRLAPSWLALLDWITTNALAQHLCVILDLHEYDAMGEAPAANKEKFLAFWRQLSEHCATAPDRVLFELLNEPSRELTPALWNDYLREALAIVRQRNPVRTVIVGPGYWNGFDHLSELKLPETDRHLIVTVHYYVPMDFTHQGAPWVGRQNKLGVSWQAAPEELTRLNHDFDVAADWAKTQRRPILLGEFGAYDQAPMESRVRYISHVARAAEARGWSWAYWQFDSDFILYDVGRDAWVEPIRRALIPGT